MIGLVELMHANEVSRSALPNSVLNHEREAMIEFGVRNAEFGMVLTQMRNSEWC